MSDYLDQEIIAVSILLIFSTGLLRSTRKSSINWDLRFLLLFAISVPFLHVYYQNSIAVENLQSIKNGNNLKCLAGLNSYKVSIKDGWSIDKNYFIKESVLIRVDMCEDYD
jgi:hypothetical protein